jgi:hypothetical protein
MSGLGLLKIKLHAVSGVHWGLEGNKGLGSYHRGLGSRPSVRHVNNFLDSAKVLKITS